MGLEVFLAWPRLTTLETFALGMGLANVHRNTLSSECTGLVWMDGGRCGRCGSGWERSSTKGALVGRLDCASFAIGNVLEDGACLY